MRRLFAIGAACALAASAQAGVTFFPAQGAFGTLLYEDLWPCRSDLDFNDAVVRYNVATVDSGSGATRITLVLNLDAIGASRCNGLGWRLPIPQGSVASVTETLGTAGSVDGTPWDAPASLSLSGGTDVSPSGGDTVIWLTDDLRAKLCGDGAGFLNTVPGGGTTSCRPLVVDVSLSTPVTIAPQEPWDLFLYQCGDRTAQIHRSTYYGLPQGDPYAADPTLYGTCNDNSDPPPGSGGSTWYVGRSGIPYVLNLGEGNGTEATAPANYPAEREPIDLAMPRILEFADGSADGDPGYDFYINGTDPTRLYEDPKPPSVRGPATAYDADGDGWCIGADADADPNTVDVCLDGALPGDCDDADGARYPTAVDSFGDGFDQNCDGADGVDGDGDGDADVASGGGDCDDGDPAVFLGSPTCPADSCLDLKTRFPDTLGQDASYTIDPYGTGAFDAWCDMHTDGGGWTYLVNPTSMASPEFPGLGKTHVLLSGGEDCLIVYQDGAANGFTVLGNYVCNTGTERWTLSLPDAFGSTDIMFVATLQGQSTHTLAINGTAVAPDAINTAHGWCGFFNGDLTSLDPGVNGCHSTYLAASPRILPGALSGSAGLTLFFQAGPACSPACTYGAGSSLQFLAIR